MMVAERQRPIYETEYDMSEDLTTAIVFAVAAARDIDPVDIDAKLYDIIDASALKSLFNISMEQNGPMKSSVEFRFLDTEVTVRSDGRIQVFEPSE